MNLIFQLENHKLCVLNDRPKLAKDRKESTLIYGQERTLCTCSMTQREIILKYENVSHFILKFVLEHFSRHVAPLYLRHSHTFLFIS